MDETRPGHEEDVDEAEVVHYRLRPDADRRAREAIADGTSAAEALRADPSLSAWALLRAASERDQNDRAKSS